MRKAAIYILMARPRVEYMSCSLQPVAKACSRSHVAAASIEQAVTIWTCDCHIVGLRKSHES